MSSSQVSEKEFLESYPQIAPSEDGKGHPGNLDPQQEGAVAILRLQLESEGYKDRLDDATLLRFLRARKFDIEKAKAMFIACEKWRAEFGTNTILEDFHYTEKSKVAKLYPQYYHKTDKDGRPVYIEELGAIDINKMYQITTQDRMLKNLVWEYEAFVKYRLPACSRLKGHLIETSCTILDLKGLSISAAYNVYGYVREASNIGQNFYPERMGKFYCINAPFGFAAVFKTIKKFLDPVTVEKIHILGSKYQDELLKQIPAENLPEKFGGKSVGANNVPVSLSDDGPWRVEQYIGPEGLGPKSAGEGYTDNESTTSSSVPPSTASSKNPSRVPSQSSLKGQPMPQ